MADPGFDKVLYHAHVTGGYMVLSHVPGTRHGAELHRADCEEFSLLEILSSMTNLTRAAVNAPTCYGGVQ